ncbi:MAG: TfoX/Sxy family protein [Acutalibacteraceae bacterium]
MASDKEYLNFILEQLSCVEDISYRPMMGEYLLYYKEKMIGGICDNRFLVKPVSSAVALVPNAIYEAPYEGAKPMLLIDNVDDKAFLSELVTAMYDELPLPKKRKRK